MAPLVIESHLLGSLVWLLLAAATGVVAAAFGFQGQKCSAASRGYIPKSLWPRVREGLETEMAKIKMGPVAVSPYELHPLKMGNALLTLNEISNGRAQIGVAAGDGGVNWASNARWAVDQH